MLLLEHCLSLSHQPLLSSHHLLLAGEIKSETEEVCVHTRGRRCYQTKKGLCMCKKANTWEKESRESEGRGCVGAAWHGICTACCLSLPSYPPVFVDNILTLTAKQLGVLIILFVCACVHVVLVVHVVHVWQTETDRPWALSSLKSCTHAHRQGGTDESDSHLFTPKRKPAQSFAYTQFPWIMSKLNFDIFFFSLPSSSSISLTKLFLTLSIHLLPSYSSSLNLSFTRVK